MNENSNSYRSILKATSIFGGVQVITIGIAIIRSKFIAVLLGPLGIGVFGLITMTLGVLTGLTNFGLGSSAVRDMSAAYASNNLTRIGIVEGVLRKWVWLTGTIGLALTVVLSPWLSYLNFGHYDYTLSFMVLSVTLLISQLTSAQMVVLRASRKLKDLAKASVLGSFVGLLTTVPLYYIWGVKGIVPAIITSSITAFLISAYFRRKIKIPFVKVSKARTIAEGKIMVRLGIAMSLTGFISLAGSYFVRIYISNVGGIEQVGLYNAGFNIVITYVGMIFTAMATDYYPRLAGTNDNSSMIKMVNEQSEIAILLLGPLVVTFILYINQIIPILYSDKFIAINTMVIWASISTLIKVASWGIGFMFVARGNTKLFFWNEVAANIYFVVFNILGYQFFGLTGLGFSFGLSYLIYYVQVFIISKNKYEFSYRKSFYKIFGIQFTLALVCLMLVLLKTEYWGLFWGSIIFVASCYYSFYELNKRLEIVSMIKEKLKTKR